jgi:NadR type nicotinamide-nucleotide adenylyltransferase
MKELKKIVIIGPESTGKSTLCRQLARHYDTVWCPEYAREYLIREGKDYNYDDLLQIAKGQWAQEEALSLEARNGLYFIDTNQYVMKVWCEVAFGECHKWILDRVAEQKNDLYLLCNTDLPWVEDELREYPDPAFREKLFLMYKDLLVNNGTPWEVISGREEERFDRARIIIDHFLSR